MYVALLQVVGSRPEVDAVLVVAGLLVLEHGVEQCVHQRGLADARFACVPERETQEEGFLCKCTSIKYLNYIEENLLR